jgi:seryl-tRNA synthetase
MPAEEPLTIHDGLATLGPELVRIRALLEDRFLVWAADVNAEVMLFPPLLRIRDLDRLDYFRNFPHLATVISRIQPERLSDDYVTGGRIQAIPVEHLTASGYALPSAACYNVFLHLHGSQLSGPRYVTTVAACFRNEQSYDALRRLWAFTMREIVCLGSAEEVKAHLRSYKCKILEFAASIDLPLVAQAAADPFYQPSGSRATMQKLFPQKEELIYGGSVAIASINFHRNFFGERCAIRTVDRQFAFSGCVAFGIERWLHALLDRFGNPDAAAKVLASAPEPTPAVA